MQCKVQIEEICAMQYISHFTEGQLRCCVRAIDAEISCHFLTNEMELTTHYNLCTHYVKNDF